MIDTEKIIHSVDHTLLRQDAVWEEIRTLCDEAVRFGAASVCIPPSFVRQAAGYLGGKIPVCTVIGFPNGYSTTAAKCFETGDAVDNGADEIDMVINIGWAKEGRFEDILTEINAVKKACRGRLLKVIVETCLLTQEEKRELCRVVSQSGADYIKTSTGFSSGGATREDVALFASCVTGDTKIKAAGGISSLEDAKAFLELGASRLGTSRIIRLIKEKEGLA